MWVGDEGGIHEAFVCGSFLFVAFYVVLLVSSGVSLLLGTKTHDLPVVQWWHRCEMPPACFKPFTEERTRQCKVQQFHRVEECSKINPGLDYLLRPIWPAVGLIFAIFAPPPKGP
jgi:hypothetical protein